MDTRKALYIIGLVLLLDGLLDLSITAEDLLGVYEAVGTLLLH